MTVTEKVIKAYIEAGPSIKKQYKLLLKYYDNYTVPPINEGESDDRKIISIFNGFIVFYVSYVTDDDGEPYYYYSASLGPNVTSDDVTIDMLSDELEEKGIAQKSFNTSGCIQFNEDLLQYPDKLEQLIISMVKTFADEKLIKTLDPEDLGFVASLIF